MKEILQQILGELINVNTRLGGVESRLDSIESRLGNVESRLDSVESRLGNVESRLDSVETRLDGVETGQKEIYQIVRALEARTAERCALLNRIVQDLDYMKGNIKSIQEGQASLSDKVVDLGTGQRYIMQKITQHDVDIFKLKEAVIKNVSGL